MPTPYDPTPAEIATACERIRSAWTPEEFHRRVTHLADGRPHAAANVGKAGWLPPVVAVDPEVAAMLEVR
jgi:hypothetical protein